MNRLKQLRKENNMTQENLAEKLHLKRSVISKYESGSIPLTDGLIIEMTELFGVTADYLLGKSEPDSPFKIDLDQLNPLTGKKMTSREKKQYREVMESATQALFFDDEISEQDKEIFFESITEAFWEAKKMNRRKKEHTEA